MTNKAQIATLGDLERLPVATLVIELDGTVLDANAAAVRLLGTCAPGSSVWQVVSDLRAVWPGLVIAAGERASASTSVALDTRTIDVTAAMRDIGRPVMLCVAIDVTHHKLETGRVVESKERLESLGLVAGGVAHDFNNQLVSVLAEASAAREDLTLPDATRDALRRIEASAKRMSQLTRQLLAYAGRGRFVAEMTDPDEMLDQERERLAQLVPDGAIDVMPGAGSLVIEADRGLLRQVLENLVSNAADALPSGGGAVRVASKLISRQGMAWWQLEVSDNGVGMNATTIARIFDPFFTTKPGRHGLGLSAVHGTVRRLGGDIEVDSQPGKGSKFRIRFPVVPNAEPTRRRTTSRPPPIKSLRGMRILVADDEPSVRATVRRLLERRGATVVTANDGADAEARMREGQYGLLVFDVMMPSLTGYELLTIARRMHPDTPVMLMSGYTEHDARAGEEPDLFLEKPFTTKTLDAAIEQLLESARS